MTLNKLIREMISLPKDLRTLELNWGKTVRIKTKAGHDVTITINEFFAHPDTEQETTARDLGEIPFDVVDVDGIGRIVATKKLTVSRETLGEMSERQFQEPMPSMAES